MSHRCGGRPSRADEALDQLSRVALREHSMSSLLQRVADLSNGVMPGDTETTVSLLLRGRPATPASTAPLANELDGAQFGDGDGPCMHAARTGELTEITDNRSDDRWPMYARRAVEHGYFSSLSVPLQVDHGVDGAINTYARKADAFDEESRSVAVRFAPYAAVAIANMQTYQHAREMADNLQAALETRAIIDQAKGILLERYKVTPEQAFHLLAQVSMRTNVKLRDVADGLVRTGTFILP
jgi:GAF domain-containing protein